MMKWDQREVSRASDSWFLTQLWKGWKRKSLNPNKAEEGEKIPVAWSNKRENGVPTAALCHCLWWGIVFLLPAVSFLFSQTHTPFCWNIAANAFPPIRAYLLTTEHLKDKYQPSHLPLPSDNSVLYFFQYVLFLFSSKTFCTGVLPINNVVIVSGKQWGDWATHMCISILPQAPIPSRLAHSIEHSSMCYTVVFCWYPFKI